MRCVIPHSEPVYSYSLSLSVSNTVGNESSESMRDMCGCVSFSVRANTQVYAPRSRWNVQKVKEITAEKTQPPHPQLLFSLLLYSLFFPIILTLSLSPLLLCRVTMLSFNPLQAGLLDRNKRLICLFMWLWTSQGKALAKEQWRTMETAWSCHRAGLMRKPPSCKKSLWEISPHATVLYWRELWDFIVKTNPG